MNPDRNSSGSQKETPTVHIDSRGGNAVVRGYHGFSVAASRAVTVFKKRDKYDKVNAMLKNIKSKYKTCSFMDVGANTGIVSFMAETLVFDPITALDHDRPAIDIIDEVSRFSKTHLLAQTFSFGDEMPRKADLVYVGSLIHWVWCLTANFEGDFERILRYLFEYTNKILVVEFVEPEDRAIKEFGHTKRCLGTKKIKEPYTTNNFRAAIISSGGQILSNVKVEATRVQYVIRVPPPSNPGVLPRPNDAVVVSDRETITRNATAL